VQGGSRRVYKKGDKGKNLGNFGALVEPKSKPKQSKTDQVEGLVK
jgi:hypothetical protein